MEVPVYYYELPEKNESIQINSNAERQTSNAYGILLTVQFYKSTPVRDLLWKISVLLSLGILYLFYVWWPIQVKKLIYKGSDVESQPTYVLAKTSTDEQVFCRIYTISVRSKDLLFATAGTLFHPTSHIQVNQHENLIETFAFDFLCEKFVLVANKNEFYRVRFPLEGLPFLKLYDVCHLGLENDHNALQSMRNLFGECKITIPTVSSLRIAANECLQPFYVFQICSVGLWISNDYALYAISVCILIVFSLFLSVRDTYRNSKNLQKMVSESNSDTVLLRRRSMRTTATTEFCLVDSKDLLPGDVIRIKRSLNLPCDVLLLQGNAIVDESMMTGESKPVYKSSIPKTSSEIFCIDKNLKYIIHGGSVVRDVSQSETVEAIVINTGFATKRGRMMRSLIHQIYTSRLNFQSETWKFVGLMSIIACLSFSWTITQGLTSGLPVLESVQRALDTITIAIPPALPIIVTIGTLCASEALRTKHKIRSLIPSRINAAGRATVCVFDKTGTLTEDDEDLFGVVPTTISSRVQMRPNNTSNDSSVNFESLVQRPVYLNDSFLLGLASCHSLSIVDGELIGDALDYQMFRLVKWKLVPPENEIDDQSTTTTLSRDSEDILKPERFLCLEALDVNSILNFDKDELKNNTNEDSSSFCKSSVVENDYLEKRISRNEKVTISIPGDVSVSSPSHSDDAQAYFSSKENNDDNIEEKLSTVHNVSSAFPSSLFSDDPQQRRDFAIIRVFEFSPELQRMSVIVYDIVRHEFHFVCKGAAEQIKRLCTPESCPESWTSVLEYYSAQGLRIIALAQRKLDPSEISFANIKTVSQKQLEHDLIFQGFLLFTNLLRPDSPRVIKQLRFAQMHMYIATGDNLITAVAVARHSGFISKNTQFLITAFFDNKTKQIKWKRQLLIPKKLNNQIELKNQTRDTQESTETGLLNTDTPKPTTITTNCFDSNNEAPEKQANMSVVTRFCSKPSASLNAFFSSTTKQSQENDAVLTTSVPTSSITPTTSFNDTSVINVPAVSDTLWPFIKGSCLSDVCFAMTGDALQAIVEGYANTKNDLETFMMSDKPPTSNLNPSQVKPNPVEPDSFSKPGVFVKRIIFALSTQSTESKLETVVSEETTATVSPSRNVLVSKTSMEQKYQNDKSSEHHKTSSITLLEFVLRYVHIYGRMTPDHKLLLVQQLQLLPENPIVAMCGDGANDCSALRAADVGISLSSCAASVAAPFNSIKKSINGVIHVLREGRGALASNIQNFQFVAVYSVVQLCSVIVLGPLGSYLGDHQFLYVDLMVVLPLTTLMSWSQSGRIFNTQLPQDRLLARSVLISLFAQNSLHIFFQYFCAYFLIKVIGKNLKPSTDLIISPANTVIFILTNFQIITSAIILSFGSRPWKRVTRNFWLLLLLGVLLVISIAIVLNEAYFIQWLRDFLELTHLPLEIRLWLFVSMIVNALLSLCIEEILIRRVYRKYEHNRDQLKYLDKRHNNKTYFYQPTTAI